MNKNIAYQVLARKYRPQAFDMLIGQDAMVRTLSNAFKINRIAHAFMLSGIRGVGKTSTARLLARALNYESDDIHAPSLDFKDKGKHCQAIIEAQHPDVTEIDAASHNGVDDVRNLIEQCQYRPIAARYRVYIIDEVHMLSTQAFNALLKILEEPPPFVKFIFATTEIRKLPITILSRCQHFALKRLSVSDVAEYLDSVLQKENMTAQQDVLYTIAQFSEGSMRDALSILDTVIAYSDGDITMEALQDIFGLTNYELIINIFEKIMSAQTQEALNLFRQCYIAGAEPIRILQDLAEFCHEVCRYKMVQNDGQFHRLSELKRQKIKDYASCFNLAQLDRFWQCLMSGIQEMSVSHAHLSSAEMLIIRLCCLSVLPTPDDIHKMLQGETDISTKTTVPQVSPIDSDVQIMPQSMDNSPKMPMNNNRDDEKLPAISLVETLQETGESLCDFNALLIYLGNKKELKLKLFFEKDVYVISYQLGKIILRLCEGVSSDIIGIMRDKLAMVTQQSWEIVLSDAEGQPSVIQQKEQDKLAKIEEIRQTPEIIQFEEHFPHSEIVDVVPLKKEKA